jgi:NADPH-dependent ferric siderophore reductase
VLRVVDSDGEHITRVDFEERVDDPDDVTPVLFSLVVKAAAESGESIQPGETAIRTFLTEVVAVEMVTPALVQVTFGGGDLATFESAGPDSFLYLLLPPPGRTELGIDQDFTWEAHATMAPEDQPRGAYYTLRQWRPEAEELDIWMVLHGDEGYASAWARSARPGDKAALWGPRTAYTPPEGTEHLLLVADETGLPAVAGIIESMPVGWTATVVAESDAAHRQPLPTRDWVDVHWCDRTPGSFGTSTRLVDAVKELPELPENTYVWGGGESRAITAVRRHVRDERGFDREKVSLVAYWRADLQPTT